MKRMAFKESGQALILITLAAIGLVGIVGLAIDGSAKFSDRRHAQNAADSAALAGSLALVNPATESDWENIARNRASDNGYVGDLANNQVWVYKCSVPKSDAKRNTVPNNVDCGIAYEGNSSYVQVVIKSEINTYFARIFGIRKTQNIVNAVTYWKPRGENYDGNLIVALNPNACSGGGADGNLVLGTSGGGTGVINLTGGGAYVNSSAPGCGMNLTGCPVVNITNGELGSSGTGNINLSSSSGTCSSSFVGPTPTYSNDPYPFPPEMPDEPSECVSPAGTFTSNSSTHITTLNPGRYNEFPPKSGGGYTVYDTINMNPGIYCVNDVVKLTDQHLQLTGHNVTVFIRKGYSFSLQGGSIVIDAPDSGDYAGYAIIVDSDFTGSPKNCVIDGNSENSFTGTIFAPYCNLTINGTSDPTSYSAQLIAYTVKLNGSAAVNLTYNVSDNAKSQPKVGLIR
jgi:Flp pilus assembly protein TadG